MHCVLAVFRLVLYSFEYPATGFVCLAQLPLKCGVKVWFIRFISQSNPLSSSSWYFETGFGICFFTSSMKSSSVSKELLNFQNPGPRFVSVLSEDIETVKAEWSEKMFGKILTSLNVDCIFFAMKK